ncbi:hypothetical protein APHAL10511_008597 [Amanita phalloides]|nr:hypothetical protein APHAL10511_008597 [Amanita phalloides]
MRWSQILSAFVTLVSLQSLLSFALVTTQNSEILDKRDKNDRIKSSSYRRNSMLHPYAYNFQPSGQVTRRPIPVDERKKYNREKLRQKGTDADHIFEGQMYTHHVEKVLGKEHRTLPQTLKDAVKHVLNRPSSVAPVPATINRSKGQMIKAGLKGNHIQRLNPATRHYSLATYPSAAYAAEDLQHAFEHHGYGAGHPTFKDTLRSTYENAQILTPSRSSRSHAGSSYQQVAPNHYVYTPGPSVQRAYVYSRDMQDAARGSGSRRA